MHVEGSILVRMNDYTSFPPVFKAIPSTTGSIIGKMISVEMAETGLMLMGGEEDEAGPEEGYADPGSRRSTISLKA